MSTRLNVPPGALRLPPSRRAGPDPVKYVEQVSRFGSTVEGMPPLQVTLAGDGEMMINDGVTRAFRVHRLAPAGTMVTAEVIEERPAWRLDHLPRVRDL